MSDIKPNNLYPGEDAELREKSFPANEPGLTTSFSGEGEEVITQDGPQSPHVQSQDEFWDGVETADQTPKQVENQAAPLNPNEFPGETSNRSDATGDTESSVLI